jgi:hypothetical protein
MMALAGLIGLASVSPSSARVWSDGGLLGRYTVPSPRCDRRIIGDAVYGINTALPPRVWARDAHSGAGNDSAWVRYRLHEVNTTTGAAVASTSWSGWSRAGDVEAAGWTGSAEFAHPLAGQHYSIVYIVQIAAAHPIESEHDGRAQYVISVLSPVC